MVKPYIPERGDLVWLEFNPQSGREQAGRRPALILSPKSYNEQTGLMIACPVTSRVKGYPFECALPKELAISGVILADHVKSLDWKVRRAAFICAAPDETLADVRMKLSALLD